MHVECHGLRFDLPDKWVDVTDDLPPGTAAILARPTGVGAAKFSISRYQGGEDPAATIEDL